jgi:hypothetical protein
VTLSCQIALKKKHYFRGNWTNRIKFLLYFVAEMMETAFYCVPLEFVVNAVSDDESLVQK